MRAVWILMLLLAGCASKVPVRPHEAAYVDPRACTGCHAGIASSYRQTRMARAFTRATKDNVVTGRLQHKLSGREYGIHSHDGGFFFERVATGGFRDRVEIHFVMGSGAASRSYLHQTAEGRLYELPVAWYAENGGLLAMSPGYDRARHYDMQRQISYDCMFCHNGYPRIPAAAERVGADPVFSALPEGIDCQRCHGAGSLHVASPKQAGLIVNPRRLDHDRRAEICLQCHLETTSFALPNSIVRYERGPFSYRPGEALGSFMMFFDHAAGSGREEKFEIVSAAYRLRQSRCFNASGERMTCTTCHDPHSAVKPAAAQCRQCHAQPASGHPARDDCATCHMPKRRTEDVVHAVVTDHRIARRHPEGLTRAMAERHESGERKYRGEVVLYYPSSLPASPERDLYLATAQVKQGSNPEQGRKQLAEAIQRHKPSGPEFYFDLAQADGSIDGFEATLKKDPSFVPARRNLGAALVRAGRAAEAVAVLVPGRAAKPCDAALLNELARALVESGRGAEARSAAEDAIRCNPRLPEPHNTLGGILYAAGQADAARTLVARAVALDPDSAETIMNLGALTENPALLRRAVELGSPAVKAQARKYLEQLGAR